jgi:hypothetical protein
MSNAMSRGRGYHLWTLIMFLSFTAVASHGAEWRPLFNGSLEGWRSWLGVPEASILIPGLSQGPKGKYQSPLGWDKDPTGVVKVVSIDGQPAIRLSGEVFGILATKESFGNYHLRLQFKWGEKKWAPREKKPRDSGVLYHLHSEPGVSWGTWPASQELQIQEKDCGDLFTLKTQIKVRARRSPAPEGTPGAPSGYYTYDPAGELYTFEEETAVNNHCIRAADHEKPHGEWNTVELLCVGDESVYVVNGHVVMRLEDSRQRDDTGKWVPLVAGPIALQIEGAEVFYRNVEVRTLDTLPSDYQAKP